MPIKRIVISAHAQFEMRRRGIGRSEVIATVRKPDQVLPSEKGRQIYQCKLAPAGRMLLRVIVKEVSQAYQVITAYKTSKIAKYWRSP